MIHPFPSERLTSHSLVPNDASSAASPSAAGKRLPSTTRNVLTGVVLLLVLTAGAYIPTPLYPGYQADLGFSDLTLIMVYAMFALVSVPSLLLFGPASDVVGRRTVLLASIVLAAAGSACFLYVGSVFWLFLGRAFHGMALGAVTGPATACVIESSAGRENKHKVWASVLATMAFVGGTAAGPFFSGVLTEWAPLPESLPYLVHFGFLAGCWILVLRMPRVGMTSLRRWRPTAPRVPRQIRRLFMAAATTGFLAWTGAGIFLATIPTVLERAVSDATTAMTGGVLGAMLLFSMATQPLIVGINPIRMQIMGLGLIGASLGVLALDGGTSLDVVLGSAVFAGAGHGLAYGGASAMLDGITPSEFRGGVNAALYLVFYMGAGVPAIAVGILTSWLSMGVAVSLMSAAASIVSIAVCIVLAIVWSRRRRGAAGE
ncbi:MFS transporter [Kocuria sp. TGY1127_2]|uniref:MFS transporter n=1 Tax=Kocuria sp. TGY1127_2 TaxID=2711328 RepID=UPI0015BB202C|nr:MFS transporter [Kocuria sp. TGY1127_2]